MSENADVWSKKADVHKRNADVHNEKADVHKKNAEVHNYRVPAMPAAPSSARAPVKRAAPNRIRARAQPECMSPTTSLALAGLLAGEKSRCGGLVSENADVWSKKVDVHNENADVHKRKAEVHKKNAEVHNYSPLLIRLSPLAHSAPRPTRPVALPAPPRSAIRTAQHLAAQHAPRRTPHKAVALPPSPRPAHAPQGRSAPAPSTPRPSPTRPVALPPLLAKGSVLSYTTVHKNRVEDAF